MQLVGFSTLLLWSFGRQLVKKFTPLRKTTQRKRVHMEHFIVLSAIVGVIDVVMSVLTNLLSATLPA
jgi:hypothetical protein